MAELTPVLTQVSVDGIIDSVLRPLVQLVPSLLAAALVLVIGFLLGGVLGNRVYLWSRGRRVDEKAGDTPAAEFVDDGDDPVSSLLGTLVRLLVYGVAVAIAVGFLGIDQLNRLVAVSVGYAPNLFAAVAVLILGFGLGRVVGAVVRRGVGATDLGAAFSRTLLGGALGAGAAGFDRLAGQVVAYYIYFLSVYVAVGTLSLPVLSNVLAGLVVYYPAAAGAALVLVVGAVVAEFVGRHVRHSEATDPIPETALVGRAIEALIYLFAAVIALSAAGVATDLLVVLLVVTVLPLTLAAGIAVGIAFGYGGRDSAEAFLDNRL